MPNNALLQIKQDTLSLIDDLKVICKDAGLGNDGNEYKIITQCFLYKFLCDKFEFLFEQEFPNQTIQDYKDFNEEEKEDFFITLIDKRLPKLTYDDLLSYLFEKHFNDNDLHLKLDIIFNRTLAIMPSFLTPQARIKPLSLYLKASHNILMKSLKGLISQEFY